MESRANEFKRISIGLDNFIARKKTYNASQYKYMCIARNRLYEEDMGKNPEQFVFEMGYDGVRLKRHPQPPTNLHNHTHSHTNTFIGFYLHSFESHTTTARE